MEISITSRNLLEQTSTHFKTLITSVIFISIQIREDWRKADWKLITILIWAVLKQ